MFNVAQAAHAACELVGGWLCVSWCVCVCVRVWVGVAVVDVAVERVELASISIGVGVFSRLSRL